jgi:hypothetical protein
MFVKQHLIGDRRGLSAAELVDALAMLKVYPALRGMGIRYRVWRRSSASI